MRRAALAGLLVLGLTPALALLASPVGADAIVLDLDITGPTVIRDSSFILSGNITVRAGGLLTLDHVSIQVRMAIDNSREIRVEAGGELRILNGTRIYSQFASVAYSLHYIVFVEPGAHFVLQNSTLDYPYWVAVGDEAAVIENSAITHAVMALHGWNLTVENLTIFDSNIGFWLSGHSLIRNSRVDVSTVYGGILDGISRVEDSSFAGSGAADLALLDEAVAVNTTHRNSNRAAIMLGNSSMMRADIGGMLRSAIQLGDEDFKYGCGIFYWNPPEQWLNLHMFPFFYRINNTVTLADITITNSPGGIVFAADVWRRAHDVDVLDNCFDPPFETTPEQPLHNSINLTFTRPSVIDAAANVFNGSLTVLPGASLTLRGGSWRFLSEGPAHRVTSRGDSLVLEGVHMSSGLIDFSANAVNETRASAPDIDIAVEAGAFAMRDSWLEDLGTSADPDADAGIFVADGAGPVEVNRSVVNGSARGVSLGCCGLPSRISTTLTVDSSTLETEGPPVVLGAGNLTLRSSVLASSASAGIFARAPGSSVHMYGADAQVAGPGRTDLYRYGLVQARVVWEDLRPAPFLPIGVRDFSAGTVVGEWPTDVEGWAAPTYVLFRTTSWDGAAESGGPAHLFLFNATYANASASSVPTDVEGGASITLALPDDRPPVLTLNLPPEYYSTQSGGVFTGEAQDLETGVTVVELSVDGGPFFALMPPSAPRLGVVNFSFAVAGLAPGIHVLAVRAWDSVGNTAEASAYFIHDDQYPSVTLPFGLVTNTRALNVSGKLSEPGYVEMKGNGTDVDPNDYSFTLPLFLDIDAENIEVLVRDLAGNEHNYSFVVRLDVVAPQLEITRPQNGSWVNNDRLQISGLIEFNAQLRLNGVPLTVSSVSNFTILAVLVEGENVLVLTAVDRAGNENRRAVTVFLDSVAPPLDVLGPDAARPSASRDVLLVLRTEPGAEVSVANESLTAQGALVEVPLRLQEGRTVLSITVSDRGGNRVVRSLAITVDTVPPTVFFTGGNRLATANATLFLTGVTEANAQVQVGGYAVQSDGAGGFSLPLRLHAGTNRLPVQVRDGAGNLFNTTLEIEVDEPPRTQAPGFAPPEGGAMALLAVGAALCLALPYTVRFVARRREQGT